MLNEIALFGENNLRCVYFCFHLSYSSFVRYAISKGVKLCRSRFLVMLLDPGIRLVPLREGSYLLLT